MTNRLIEFIRKKGSTPVVPLVGFPGLKLIDKSVKEGLTDPKVQADAIDAIVREFGVDAVFCLMDLTVEAEALGAQIRFEEKAPPSVVKHPWETPEIFRQSRLPDPSREGRMPVFIEAINRIKERVQVPVGAYIIGPFTLAGEMMKVEKELKAVIREPLFLAEVLDFCEDVLSSYASALVESGADILTVLEPTASMLSPKQFREFSGIYVQRIFSKVPKAIPVLHICGNTTVLLEEMAQTEAEGLSLDAPVELGKARKELPSEVVLIGNIDPVRVLLQGSPQAIIEKVRLLRKEMEASESFILSSGCDLPMDVPLENLHAFMDAAREPL